MEFGCTNLNEYRFQTVMRQMKIKQFYYPENIAVAKRQMVCRACHQSGHMKNNKNCPFHKDQPEPYFHDSDSDADI